MPPTQSQYKDKKIYTSPDGTMVRATGEASADRLMNELGSSPTRFKVDIPENLPSQALGSTASTRSVMNTRNSLESTFQNFLSQQQKLTGQLADTQNLAQNKDYSATLKELSTLRTDIADRKIAAQKTLDEYRNPGVARGFANDERLAIKTKAERELADLATREQAAQTTLSNIIDANKIATDGIKTQIQINNDTLAAFKEYQALTKPDVLKTDVNPQTGDVIAFVQDPNTGAVTSQTIGNIGVSAKDQYISTGTYRNGSNQEVFYGVKPDGTATQIVLGTSGVGDGGFNINEVLSITEAQSLGVPYGTTRGQVIGRIPTKPPTEAQGSASLYATRMSQANQTIESSESKVISINPASYAAQVLAEPSAIGNALISDDIRQQRQAERNFLNSVLRRESGAVISPSEFAEGAKQYFPRPGDDATTLEQKRANRATAIAQLQQQAGPAYNQPAATSPTTSNVGKIVNVNGKRYQVAEDGDTLIEIK